MCWAESCRIPSRCTRCSSSLLWWAPWWWALWFPLTAAATTSRRGFSDCLKKPRLSWAPCLLQRQPCSSVDSPLCVWPGARRVELNERLLVQHNVPGFCLKGFTSLHFHRRKENDPSDVMSGALPILLCYVNKSSRDLTSKKGEGREADLIL